MKLRRIALSLIIIVLLSIICGCYSEEDNVIKIMNHKLNTTKNGIIGIDVDFKFFPDMIKDLKNDYTFGIFFFYSDKSQIKSKEVKSKLEKQYIKDLSYKSSSKGNLAFYKLITINKNNSKNITDSFFIPYDILPFYMDYLALKKKQTFYIRIDLFYESNIILQSEYYEINLD